MKRLFVLWLTVVFMVALAGVASAKSTPVYLQESAVGPHYVIKESLRYLQESQNVRGVNCDIVIHLNEKGNATFKEDFPTDKDLKLVVLHAEFRQVGEKKFIVRSVGFDALTVDNELLEKKEYIVKDITQNKFWLDELNLVLDVFLGKRG